MSDVSADMAMSVEQIQHLIDDFRNWGRWGVDDQVGTVNLVTPAKTAAAARLVQSGRTVSLSREIPKNPATNNPKPAQHFMQMRERYPNQDAGPAERGGVATDFLGVSCHGTSTTHLDALCHAWDGHGMWNGRDAAQEIVADGTTWGGIDAWKDGIVTRGVLLDVPKYRGVPYVEHDRPVTGSELEAIAASQGVQITPGDAVVIHSGREAWALDHPAWGSPPADQPPWPPTGREKRPGLHASCLGPLREWDCSMLVWDMLDLSPNGYGLPWAVHAAIFSYGLALLDNALLEPLAALCAEEARYEFMLTVAPLFLVGGTGSPVNPIAIF